MAKRVGQLPLKRAACLCAVLLSVFTISCVTGRRFGVRWRLFPFAGVGAAIERAVAQVKPALVRVAVVEADYSRGRESKRQISGSGVIIDKEGHVVTNHHVAGKARRLVCTLTDKRELDADLIGTDPLSDLAVLKLRGEPGEEFPFATFGDSSTLEVGDRVMAMGSPMSLSQSVTLGIVSNLEMIMPQMFRAETFTLDGENVGSLIKWIGHDAAIFGGNSGGPLVDMNGAIVGINEIKMGLSGAIPSNTARQIAGEIVETGYVNRSWAGFEIQPLLKGSGLESGIVVSGTIEGSPAADAGVHSGDVLVEFAGAPVSARYSEELPSFTALVASLPVGSEVDLVVLRDGEEKTLTLRTAKREKVQLDRTELKEWGAVATNISMWMQKTMKRDSRDGALIFSVRPGGPCDSAKPSLRRNDVIVAVNDQSVSSAEDLVTFTEEVTAGQTELVPVLVAFERRKQRLLTVVKVGLRKLDDPGLEARKAWLPVETQVLTNDLAEALEVSGKSGVRVIRVYPDVEAELDLEVGDLIVGLDGQRIPATEPEDVEVLPTMIRQYRIGSDVELDVIRDRERVKVTVTLPTSRKLPREMKKYRDDNFEITVREIAFNDRAVHQWDADKQGVLVQEVARGSWAALGHLAAGDLLLEVDGQQVEDVKTFETIMTRISDEKPGYVVLKVLRGIHTRYVEVEPNWEEVAGGEDVGPETDR